MFMIYLLQVIGVLWGIFGWFMKNFLFCFFKDFAEGDVGKEDDDVADDE